MERAAGGGHLIRIDVPVTVRTARGDEVRRLGEAAGLGRYAVAPCFTCLAYNPRRAGHWQAPAGGRRGIGAPPARWNPRRGSGEPLSAVPLAIAGRHSAPFALQSMAVAVTQGHPRGEGVLCRGQHVERGRRD